MSREPFVCTGHDGLDDKTLRKHNLQHCKNDATRLAVNAYQRANRAAAKAAKATFDEAAEATPAAEPEYVDHFKVAAAQPVEDVAIITGTITDSPDVAAPHPEGNTPTPKPKPPLKGTTLRAHGASRRLRGLTNLGYTPKELATHTGLSIDSIWWLLIAPPTMIKAITHTSIDRTFKSLRVQLKTATVDSPEVRNTARARGLAEAHNWAGAFDWENIDDATATPNTAVHRTTRAAAQLAQAIADGALDDIAIPAAAAAPVAPVAPVAIDTTELDQLRATNAQLAKEKTRQAGTISTLQADARTSRQDYSNLHELKNLILEEMDEVKAANINLHEQLTDAKFDNPTGPRGIAGTVELDTTTSEAPDAFTIGFEPSPAGGFTLTLPSALLTR